VLVAGILHQIILLQVLFVAAVFNLNVMILTFQVVPLTAAVIVTTPQKLAFIDVAKGVRMFSKLKVCAFVLLTIPIQHYPLIKYPLNHLSRILEI